MTDNEIIKALECCGFEYGNLCSVCPKYEKDNDFCQEELHNYALDIINRQKAEIERLKGSVIVNNIMESQKIKREAKFEAIKEFAERLKEIVKFTDDTYECWEIEGYIDNLVKEMLGDENKN